MLNIFFSSLLFNRSERQLDEVVIALVGKYTALEDAYASVLKALNHAALFCKRKLNIRVRSDRFISIKLKNSIIVCSFNRFRSKYTKRGSS
jgi:CTP synthase (UTP-ammonia lyase)